MVGVSFAVEPGEAAYVPLAHSYMGVPQQLDRDAVLKALKPLLEDPNKAKVGQHAKYDINVLANASTPIEVRGEDHPFVSRGGVKLAGDLDGFGVDVRGKLCLDVGASTGGFTDCLLQRGAAKVVAVDVGYGQLHEKLRKDARVVSLERTNARTMTLETLGLDAPSIESAIRARFGAFMPASGLRSVS